MPRRVHLHAAEPNIAEVASLIGDPGRAAMLLALLDGRDLPASELAYRAHLTPQAATAHLKKLVVTGLLAVRPSGRHRLFSLASADVGIALERLAAIARPAAVVALSQSSSMQRLREARSCYDHLAGRLGVALTDGLVRSGTLRLERGAYALAAHGREGFASLGIDVEMARANRRSFARACLDWTERRPHLAGSLGASLRDLFLKRGWVIRNTRDRALRVTESGREAIRDHFDFDF